MWGTWRLRGIERQRGGWGDRISAQVRGGYCPLTVNNAANQAKFPDQATHRDPLSREYPQ
jgi:hypothetical protein